MKHTKVLAIATLLLLGVSAATAQALGDYAREARKNKTQPSTTGRHYDNDNLPTGADLSVVGPPPAGDQRTAPDSGNAKSAEAAKAAADSNAAAAERQKASDELKMKIDKQQEKIDSLSHELDLEQREYRLRAAAMYGDAGNRLRNSAQWDKDETQFKNDIDNKHKAIDAAKQELEQLQEQARKGVVEPKDNSKDNTKDNDKDPGKDRDKDRDRDKDKDKDK